jgi:hypothetical protein
MRIWPRTEKTDKRCENGSIVVEAAIVIPMLLALFMAMLTLIHIVRTETALQRAVTETVKQAAVYAYPVKLVNEPSALEQFGPAGDILQVLLAGGGSSAPNPLQSVLRAAFFPLLWQNADQNILKRDGLEVAGVRLPDFNDPGKAYIVIEAEYTMPLHIPFFHPTIRFHKTAKERVWIGN